MILPVLIVNWGRKEKKKDVIANSNIFLKLG